MFSQLQINNTMMNNLIKPLLFATSFFILLCSCEKEIFGLPYSDQPIDNFESLWSEFDQLYGLFKVRNISWDSIYQVYRPQVNNDMSEEELYELLIAVLASLDDSHVGLLPTDSPLPQFQSGIGGRIDTIRDFSLDVVKGHYLAEAHSNDPFTYGFLTHEIGYLHIAWEPDENTVDKQMEDVIAHLSSASAIVVDIRNNTGGEDRGGQAIASYFTDEERLYMTNSIKNGPGPDDFTAPMEWYIRPKGFTFNQPLVLLTNRVTVSAGETLALAMRTLPQLTSVGDTTTGAFSNAVPRELPNGWLYTLSIGDWRAADGTSYEGIGLAPDIRVLNTSAALLQGQDQCLETAIELLR